RRIATRRKLMYSSFRDFARAFPVGRRRNLNSGETATPLPHPCPSLRVRNDLTSTSGSLRQAQWPKDSVTDDDFYVILRFCRSHAGGKAKESPK
ncbi:hypothetical protein, partial [uncultured Cyclobacterium sp.]|uniref:hypothetical protein n=1 Tax=uncultured Cyclobacterium sp. TaxID=453820 RepID=UPI0030EF5DED